jgi:hypothetical protein
LIAVSPYHHLLTTRPLGATTLTPNPFNKLGHVSRAQSGLIKMSAA